MARDFNGGFGVDREHLADLGKNTSLFGFDLRRVQPVGNGFDAEQGLEKAPVSGVRLVEFAPVAPLRILQVLPGFVPTLFLFGEG